MPEPHSDRSGVALVTGGTGGLGAAVCRRLAADGARVAFTYRSDTDAAERLLGELRTPAEPGRPGRGDRADQVDLSDADAVRRLLDQVERRSATLPALRWLVSTGEELYPALARRVHDVLPGVRLLNAYGPTECGDDVTHHEVTPACTAAVRLPVGGPVPNVDLYVLVEGADAWRAAADGEPGELFVGGVCVGLGYVGDPSATARAFFRDPFDPGSPTGRLYRTGDLARVEGGAVHYLGRSDRQVKVAGVRMELGEVEAVGEQHPGVERCAVVVEPATAGGDRLTAYVVPVTDPVPDAELGAHFATYLPAAMVPRAVVHLTELPLTPHGKTDHARLTSGRTA